MIITRTPLRISIGGGGSDLPSYYQRAGGMVVAAAINKYVYIAINRTFTDDYFIKYSELERARRIEDIRHPIMREALASHATPPGIEVVSLADIPAGTGLGSSGSFTVGLLRALYAFRREHVATVALAEEACAIEIDRLGNAVGKQDQYIAAFGGMTCFEFAIDGRVRTSPLNISQATLHDLEERLLLFFTGYSRNAEALLRDQKDRSEAGDAEMIGNLNAVVRIGHQIKIALEEGDTGAFADLMHEHWARKQERLRGASGTGEAAVTAWYQTAMENGARGGKLVGAGGGGFLLFYADDPQKLRKAMSGAGLSEVFFNFDHDGSTVMARD